MVRRRAEVHAFARISGTRVGRAMSYCLRFLRTHETWILYKDGTTITTYPSLLSPVILKVFRLQPSWKRYNMVSARTMLDCNSMYTPCSIYFGMAVIVAHKTCKLARALGCLGRRWISLRYPGLLLRHVIEKGP